MDVSALRAATAALGFTRPRAGQGGTRVSNAHGSQACHGAGSQARMAASLLGGTALLLPLRARCAAAQARSAMRPASAAVQPELYSMATSLLTKSERVSKWLLSYRTWTGASGVGMWV